ncbi:MAG: sugar phosphate isomerase/epimerase [Thermofilaceae archaeon]|nr:sugar phosphate isomerase/epimerase [Thermofilaceae archaeon]MCX8180335.1 sugar phosphate isomerase/epimerase [Thermofilaceae archaeon]MDW8003870.1 sugar phosphate isomerase/epimerase family protein [Thermofilaceae archaeon]
MKLSITVYSLRDYILKTGVTVPQFIEIAARLGAEGVDLGYYWRDKEEKEQAKKRLRETGLELAIYITSNDFVKPEGERRVEVEKVKASVLEAKEMDASKLRIFAGDLKPGIDATVAESWVIESLTEVSDFAADEGIILAMENHGRYFSRIDVVERILKAVNSPSLRLTFDTGNFSLAEDNPLIAADRLGTWVSHVHAKDIDVWGKPCAPGEGALDFESITMKLKAKGYDEFLSVEYEGTRDQLVGVGIGIGYLRGLLLKLQLFNKKLL